MARRKQSSLWPRQAPGCNYQQHCCSSLLSCSRCLLMLRNHQLPPPCAALNSSSQLPGGSWVTISAGYSPHIPPSGQGERLSAKHVLDSCTAAGSSENKTPAINQLRAQLYLFSLWAGNLTWLFPAQLLAGKVNATVVGWKRNSLSGKAWPEMLLGG